MRTGFRDYLSDIFNMLDMVLVFSLISVSVLRITRVNVSDTQAMATVHVQDLISWLDEGGVAGGRWQWNSDPTYSLRPGGRRPMERSVRFNHHLIALRRNRYVLDEEYDPFDVLEPRAPKKRGRRKRGPRLDLVHSVWRPRKLHGNSTDHSHAHSHAHSARRSQCRPCMERTAENAARRARCRQGLF